MMSTRRDWPGIVGGLLLLLVVLPLLLVIRLGEFLAELGYITLARSRRD